MHPVVVRGALCLSLIAFTSAACEESNAAPPTLPTIVEIKEPDFTGTLTINGGATQSFPANLPGQVTVIIKSLEPNANGTLSIGLALGTWNGTSCQLINGLFNDNAGIGSGIAGFANGAGSLCVRVFDVGALTQPVAFVVSITHF